jgi:hypothetical protein
MSILTKLILILIFSIIEQPCDEVRIVEVGWWEIKGGEVRRVEVNFWENKLRESMR